MHKQSKTRNSFTTSRQQAGAQPSPGKQGSITCNGYLGRQTPSLRTSPPSFLFPPTLYTEYDAVRYGLYLRSAGVSCPGCAPLPASCAPPARSLVGQGEKQNRPWVCVSTVQQQPKHPCVTNTVFRTNLEHSLLPAATKKMNSIIPAKTSTAGNWDLARKRAWLGKAERGDPKESQSHCC